jgi:hypothetical protein
MTTLTRPLVCLGLYVNHRWIRAESAELYAEESPYAGLQHCSRCGRWRAEIEAERNVRRLPEKVVKATCMAWLDLLVARGLLVYLDRPSPKPGTSKEGMLHVKGGPDVVGLSLSYRLPEVFAIEYKRQGGKPRLSQIEWRDKWIALGGLYLVVDSLDSQVRQFEELGLPTVGEVQV